MHDDVYLDNNSTTPIHPHVLNELRYDLEVLYGNPSTSYSIGRIAHDVIEHARARCCELLHTPHMVFVSSASEANNTVIRGIVSVNPGTPHVIMSAIEHPSVYNTVFTLADQGRCTYDVVRVDPQGLLDLEELRSMINRDTVLVCIIRSNNETGVIQDDTSIAEICRERNVHLHMDATQCVGKIPFSLNSDTAVVSAHKFRGPKGIAALLFKTSGSIHPMCTGGKQEHGLRAGTESAAMVRAFMNAVEIAVANTPPVIDDGSKSIESLRDTIENQLETMGCTINSRDVPRLPNTCSAILPHGHSGKGLMKFLNERGIFVNVGSACAQGGASGTLRAMGRSTEEESRTVRISLGTQNTLNDAERLLSAIHQFLR